MKTGKLGSASQSHGIVDAVAVTIESNSTAFYGMMSGLAEDKKGYPIREICSNAWDVARGDFDVQLPTELESIFRVRDYGTGISPDDMKSIFATAFASTKREDTSQLGGWGLGRFSPFAYLLSEESTGSYLITSWFAGTRTDYVMDLDEEGRPSLKILFSAPSDERPGLQVQFSVLMKDIEDFRKRAKEILWSFEPRPRISPEIVFSSASPVVQGDRWVLYDHSHKEKDFSGPHIRVGCVAYPINLKHPGIQIPDGFVTQQTDVLFDTEIGTVRPTLSREDLAYDSLTVNTISNCLRRFSDELVENIMVSVSQATNLFQASDIITKSVYQMESGPGFAIRAKILWRDRPVPSKLRNTDTVRIMHLPSGWTTGQYPTFNASRREVISDRCVGARVVIDHNQTMSMEKLAAANLVGQHLVWMRSDVRHRAEALILCGNPETVINLDEIKVTTAPRSKTVRKRNMHIFRGHRGSFRETREIDLAHPQIFLRQNTTNNYNHSYEGHSNYISMRMLSDVVSYGQNLGILPAEIAAVPIPHDTIIVPVNWRKLSDIIVEAFMTRLNNRQVNDISRSYLAELNPDLHRTRNFGMMNHGPKRLKEFFENITSLHEVFAVNTNDEGYRLVENLRTIGFEYPSTQELDNPVRQINERWRHIKSEHPILSEMLVGSSYGYHRSVNEEPKRQEYLRLLLIQEEYENMKAKSDGN